MFPFRQPVDTGWNEEGPIPVKVRGVSLRVLRGAMPWDGRICRDFHNVFPICLTQHTVLPSPFAPGSALVPKPDETVSEFAQGSVLLGQEPGGPVWMRNDSQKRDSR